MKKKLNVAAGLFLVLLVCGVFVTSCTKRTVNALVVQEITGPFDNPEGSIVGLDKKTVFISSAGCVSGKFSFQEGAGYITKMTLGDDGNLTLVKKDFVKDITRPWGMAVLPEALNGLPKGTVFVGVGGPPIENVSDIKDLKSGILAFDPESGRKLGMIKTSKGSSFEKVTGGPVLAINALAFDLKSNLYFTDSALGFDRFKKSGMVPLMQGVWKVEASSIERLMKGDTPGQGQDISFCYVSGCPDGIEAAPDGKLWINTVGKAAAGGFGASLYDPFGGAVYEVTDADFKAGYMTSMPIVFGLGALDGLTFTPDSMMICTEIKDKQDILLIDTKTKKVKFLGVPNLSGPADISAVERNGRLFVIIPEHTSGEDDAKLSDAAKKEVTVIELR